MRLKHCFSFNKPLCRTLGATIDKHNLRSTQLQLAKEFSICGLEYNTVLIKVCRVFCIYVSGNQLQCIIQITYTASCNRQNKIYKLLFHTKNHTEKSIQRLRSNMVLLLIDGPAASVINQIVLVTLSIWASSLVEQRTRVTFKQASMHRPEGKTDRQTAEKFENQQHGIHNRNKMYTVRERGQYDCRNLGYIFTSLFDGGDWEKVTKNWGSEIKSCYK